MKKYIFVILAICLIIFPIFAEKNSKQGEDALKNAKLTDIRKLMVITGSGELGIQVLKNMVESYKKMMPQIPSSFWDGFIAEVDANSLTELIVPIYDKYLTHDEIKDIIKFYESPSGRKLVKVLPNITDESMAVGREWGKEIGNRLIQKLQNQAEKGY